MILAAALFHTVLVFLNRRIGPSLLYPPVLFCAWWAVLLTLLSLSRNTFFEVSAQTLLVYLVGAIAFSAGGALGVATSRRRRRSVPQPFSPQRMRLLDRILILSAVLLTAAVPFYAQQVRKLSYQSGYSSFWTGVRAQTVRIADGLWRPGRQVEWETVVLFNLVTISTAIAVVAFYYVLNGSRRGWICYYVIAASFLYNMALGANGGTTWLLGAMLGVWRLQARRSSAKAIISTALGILVLFFIVSMNVNKGRMNAGASIAENIEPGIEVLHSYAVGGLVAFDRVVRSPGEVPASWSLSRVIMSNANKLGASFEVPSLHAEYTPIAEGMSTNVYTMYFAYYGDFGVLGVILLTALVGWLSTYIYMKAIAGGPVSAIMFGVVCAGILLSGFNEAFLLGFNTILKVALVALAAFRFPLPEKRISCLRVLGYASLDPRLAVGIPSRLQR